MCKKWIYQNSRYLLPNVLGAEETALVLMIEFFPRGDLACDPRVTKSLDKAFILSEVGSCLMGLGQLHAATSFFERANRLNSEMRDLRNNLSRNSREPR